MDKSRHDTARRDGVRGSWWLKQRLARILLHSSCATTSATAFVSIAKTNAENHLPPSSPGPTNRGPRSRAPAGVDAGAARGLLFTSPSTAQASVPAQPPVPGVLPVLLAPRSCVRRRRPRSAAKSRSHNGNGSKLCSPSCRYSWSSSTFTDDELAPFSSDGEAKTRSTLFSSLSFSSDSTSDFYTSTRPKNHRKPPRRTPRRAPPRDAKPADASRPTMSAQAGKNGKDTKKADKDGAGVGAAGGMAVVKQSHNPYADFRSSMLEMVVERRIFGGDAMGELLVSYLSLNSPRHHPAILAAFEAVWEAVFFGAQ